MHFYCVRKKRAENPPILAKELYTAKASTFVLYMVYDRRNKLNEKERHKNLYS